MREQKKFGKRSAAQNKVRLSKYILIMEGEKTEPLYFLKKYSQILNLNHFFSVYVVKST